MAILVIAEHDNQSLKAATLNTVARPPAGRRRPCAGGRCRLRRAAEAAAKVAGVAKVLVCDAPQYEAQTAENVAELVKGLAGGYSHVLAPATPAGKNMLPRVAALLDVAQISDIVAVESADTFVRPIYAGNALATVKSADAVKVITVRTTAFDARPPTATPRRSRRSPRRPTWA
jgi:electron transfer flavoprotein alpha subunit